MLPDAAFFTAQIPRPPPPPPQSAPCDRTPHQATPIGAVSLPGLIAWRPPPSTTSAMAAPPTVMHARSAAPTEVRATSHGPTEVSPAECTSHDENLSPRPSLLATDLYPPWAMHGSWSGGHASLPDRRSRSHLGPLPERTPERTPENPSEKIESSSCDTETMTPTTNNNHCQNLAGMSDAPAHPVAHVLPGLEWPQYLPDQLPGPIGATSDGVALFWL